ncbi:hypothetical protein ACHAWF_013499 [Thalassiosira exigua]
MRARGENDAMSVHAIAGTHVVLLGLDVKGYEPAKADSSTDLSVMMTGMTLDFDGLPSGESERGGSARKVVTRAASSSLRDEAKKPSKAVFVGFAIERRDTKAKQTISLSAQPIQAFHWGDYTVSPGRHYEYTVRRMVCAQNSIASGSNIVAAGLPVVVKITTEDPTKGKHGIYFNRGVAGSKAYAEKFGEYRKFHLVKKFGTARWKSIINPRSIPDPEKSKEALAWLSRGLEEALLQFICQADSNQYRLLATVYEFTHEETLRAFASAVERGVDVKIIRHCRGTYRTRVKRNDILKYEDGKIIKEWIPDDTTESAKEAIGNIGFDSLEHAHTWQHDTFIERRHGSGIMHNKFILLVKNGKPLQVWTGSTNPTDGGIYGQSNVGHIVRDDAIASKYMDYWERLSRDTPGRKRLSKADEDDDEVSHEPMDELNEQNQPDLEGPILSPSVKVIFSPRTSISMLQWYADRMGGAKSSVHYTAAFGVAQPIAEVLNQGQSQGKPEKGLRRSPRIARSSKEKSGGSPLLRYVLLDNKPSERSSEKNKAGAEKKGKEYVDYYDFKHIKANRIAFGAILSAEGDDKSNEESLSGLTTFVDFVHLKVCLVDALTDNPLVITGSANFSAASIEKNDENSLVIQGDTSVADVYFTEYMRLFDHFISRDKYNEFVNKRSSGKSGHKWDKNVSDESWIRPFFDPSSQSYRERLFLR